MRILVFSLLFLMFSCQTDKPVVIDWLNGQWEIVEVKPAKGDKKQFTINEFVEYFDLKKGIHQKLKPDFEGNFTSNQVADSLIFELPNHLNILTPFDTMTYKIKQLSKEELVLENEENMIYIYKRYEKLNLE